MDFWDLVFIGVVGGAAVLVVYNFFRHHWRDWRFRVAIKRMEQTLETAAMSMTLLNIMFGGDPDEKNKMAQPVMDRVDKETEHYEKAVADYFGADSPIPSPTSRTDK